MLWGLLEIFQDLLIVQAYLVFKTRKRTKPAYLWGPTVLRSCSPLAILVHQLHVIRLFLLIHVGLREPCKHLFLVLQLGMSRYNGIIFLIRHERIRTCCWFDCSCCSVLKPDNVFYRFNGMFVMHWANCFEMRHWDCKKWIGMGILIFAWLL